MLFVSTNHDKDITVLFILVKAVLKQLKNISRKSLDERRPKLVETLKDVRQYLI